jgi:hypothetical protein
LPGQSLQIELDHENRITIVTHVITPIIMPFQQPADPHKPVAPGRAFITRASLLSADHFLELVELIVRFPLADAVNID